MLYTASPAAIGIYRAAFDDVLRSFAFVSP